jgi:hypothetical protein
LTPVGGEAAARKIVSPEIVLRIIMLTAKITNILSKRWCLKAAKPIWIQN